MRKVFDRSRHDIKSAADIMRGSKQAVVLTGAGISTPSGIPDFRSSEGGLWTQVDPFEVASLTAFRYDPDSFYKWIQPLAIQIMCAAPNPAHLGLADLQRAGYIQAVITQNIDGLHQKAGSDRVIEVHGSWKYLSCTICFRSVASDDFIEPFLKLGTIPICPDCGGILKPDLVLMGEQLPVHAWLEAQELSKSCDLMIIAGSSLEILPVAGLPMRALENGAHLIVINNSDTYIDVRADIVFHEDVANIIPWIVDEIEKG